MEIPVALICGHCWRRKLTREEVARCPNCHVLLGLGGVRYAMLRCEFRSTMAKMDIRERIDFYGSWSPAEREQILTRFKDVHIPEKQTRSHSVTVDDDAKVILLSDRRKPRPRGES